ncbi:uncharacterized protein BCR38DRAFT_334894 [Pseudomassariella vexata]|uniref:Uncharacterized protein n=1 Tax=Pseudomassariella vexata TaxID=1141098 RepID=A0A1Y2EDH8_9PEZI|nr:uncharacterized protein BCR38DRAFT_334894 [Pseudomassariella vexata]ORY68865.1 hypothetical protein BCR38DRAFT_334894 [Pseudomassariella vexata]
MPSPAPIFSFSSPFRPTVSSPLSSSPICAQASQSSQLSPRDPNRRDVQSSPLQAPKFKYAVRTAKPNPLKKTRDTAQESRRKLFLNNVRQRREDKEWDRRGGDQELLKLEWATQDRRRREQKDTDLDGIVFEDEIDEVPTNTEQPPQDLDEVMADSIAQQEEAELEAMLSSSQAPARPQSPSLSDDDDYDSLFMDYLSQHQTNQDQSILLSGQMDMS